MICLQLWLTPFVWFPCAPSIQWACYYKLFCLRILFIFLNISASLQFCWPRIVPYWFSTGQIWAHKKLIFMLVNFLFGKMLLAEKSTFSPSTGYINCIIIFYCEHKLSVLQAQWISSLYNCELYQLELERYHGDVDTRYSTRSNHGKRVARAAGQRSWIPRHTVVLLLARDTNDAGGWRIE